MNQKLKYVSLALISFLGTLVVTDTLVNIYYPKNDQNAGANLAMFRNGVFCLNGTAGDWGECERGSVQSVRNLTVVNVGDTNLTVSITATGLPSDWILEWEANNTRLDVGYEVEGWLNLTIPETATVWPEWAFNLNGEA
jgi:hypothetical protein